jgi:hypothetical protein
MAILSQSLCLAAPLAPAADIPFLTTDEAKAEELYNKALDLEVQDKKDKALIYYKDVVTRYPDTQTARAAREKVKQADPAAPRNNTAASGVISRYQVNADGTAKDTETGLIWMRCSVGQEWNGKTCTGEAKEFTGEEAKAIRLEFAGYTDWRLPNIEELRTLVFCSNGIPAKFSLGKDASDKELGCGGEPNQDHASPTIVQEVFPNTPSSFVWSSSAYAAGNPWHGAWGVYFSYGYDDDGSHDDDYLVRLVRGGQ